MNKVCYKYGMRLRGFSPGCQPMNGFLFHKDTTGRYHSILYYSRQLTDKEVSDYELDFIRIVINMEEE